MEKISEVPLIILNIFLKFYIGKTSEKNPWRKKNFNGIENRRFTE